MEQKLTDKNSPTPRPSQEEQFACDSYVYHLSTAKGHVEQSENWKEAAIKAAEKYGSILCPDGRLIAAKSNAYPVPTMAEWGTRLIEQSRRVLELIQLTREQASAVANVSEAGRQETLAELAAAKIIETQMAGYSQALAEYHETAKWIAEMQTWAKACGIVQVRTTPSAKVLELNPPKRPKRTVVPGK